MSTDNSSVEYRELKGFFGYRIGSDGSLWTERITGPANGTERLTGRWRKLKTKLQIQQAKPTHTPIYRLRACLSKDGREYHRFVHILVCEAFHGPRPDGMLATHVNGDSMDNRADNVRWNTPKGNTEDAIRHGTLRRGEQHGQSRVTEDQVREIRRRFADGETEKSLGNEHGITERAIQFIVRREHYKHVI